MVPSDPLQAVLDEDYDVVKCDIEGMEIYLLSTQTLEWGSVYCLMVEISHNRLVDKHPDGTGFLVFNDILQKLRAGGFEWFYTTQSAFSPGYWAQTGSDFVLFAYRSEQDLERDLTASIDKKFLQS
jgi:hypothetical protein